MTNVKRIHTCSICHTRGHNKRSCSKLGHRASISHPKNFPPTPKNVPPTPVQNRPRTEAPFKNDKKEETVAEETRDSLSAEELATWWELMRPIARGTDENTAYFDKRTCLLEKFIHEHYTSSEEGFLTLVRNEPSQVVAQLLASENLPRPLVIGVAETLGDSDSDHSIRRATAANPFLPIRALESYAQKSDMATAIELAKNLALTGEIANLLVQKTVPESNQYTEQSEEENVTLLVTLAANPSIPGEILENMMKYFYPNDKDDLENFLECLARNPSTPVTCLTSLATHPSHYVRAKVMDNPSTPRKIRLRLNIGAREEDAVRATYLTESLCERIVGTKFGRGGLAKNPYTPEKVLYDLAATTNDDVLYRLALNPNSSERVLQRVAKTHSAIALNALVYRPTVPVSVLQHISTLKASEEVEVARVRLFFAKDAYADQAYLVSQGLRYAELVAGWSDANPHLLADLCAGEGELFGKIISNDKISWKVWTNPACPTAAMREKVRKDRKEGNYSDGNWFQDILWLRQHRKSHLIAYYYGEK